MRTSARDVPCLRLAVALALVAACGDDSGRDVGSASASASAGITQGITTITATGTDGASESGASATMEATGDASTSAASAASASATQGSTSDDSGGALKWDMGVTPDGGSLDCSQQQGDEDYAFSFIWIANTAAGEVSKIDTKTGAVAGRYRTSSGNNSPSRTTVNQYGDVLVGNRGEGGSVTMIASLEDRCVDTNQDGVITTSTGSGDVKAWGGDECVLWNVAVPADYDHGPRALAWEGGEVDPITCENSVPNPRVWVGFDGSNTYKVWRLAGATGAILDTIDIPDVGGRPYGGAVNKGGDFWMAVRGGPLVFINGQTLAFTTHAVPNTTYGMGVGKDGSPWVVTYNGGPGTDHIHRFDVQTQGFIDAGGVGGYYRGMQIDREDRVWVAGNNPCRLILIDGATDTLINDAIPLPGCGVPVGISIDADGFVWVVDQGASLAFKIDPETFAVILTVPNLNSPYTYSDMTGNGLQLVINPPG